MQGLNSLSDFEPSLHDDFFEQMLSTHNTYAWPEISQATDSNHLYDGDTTTILSSKMRTNHNSVNHLPPLPLSLGISDSCGSGRLIDHSPFKSPNHGEVPVEALYNGFSSIREPNQGLNNRPPQHFNHQGQGFAAGQNTEVAGLVGGGAPAQPRQRVRARRGQATDPHSIAERLRRERIAERMKSLQELVPNANKTDKSSMLDEIIDYVKFLRLQVKVLSMSRLGGAIAIAPLVADASPEGGNSRIESVSGCNNGMLRDERLTVTENQVAKLMEEDMGSAMQYLQGKGLCLMPISLATAISSQHRLPGEAPSTNSNISAVTVQSSAIEP